MPLGYYNVYGGIGHRYLGCVLASSEADARFRAEMKWGFPKETLTAKWKEPA